MPASVVRCTNPSCPYAGQDRRVDMAEVGPGLYSRPSLVCVCGRVPQQVARDHRPAPAAPEAAVRTQPEKRTRTAAKRG